MDLICKSDQELLGQLIGKGAARRLYKGSLRSLLDESQSDGALQQLRVAREILKRIYGEELKQSPALARPALVIDFLRVMLAGKRYEVFVCLFLNSQHHLIAAEEMFRGTVTQTAVYPREIVCRALALNAVAVILAHNHPSGLAAASQADLAITKRLIDALGLVDVQVLDHFIVSEAATLSFVENGLV